MMSGARPIDVVGRGDPVFGGLAARKLGEDVDTAAMATNSETQAMPEIIGFVPFLEIHFGARAAICVALLGLLDISREPIRQCIGAVRRAHERAERSDHVKDAGNASAD